MKNNNNNILGNNPCFGKRPIVNGVAGPFVWQSFNEVAARRNNVAGAMVKYGIKTKENVGLYSINRMEWVIAEYACYRQNFCTVTLYDTLGDDAIEFICNQSQITLCFASKEKAVILLRLKSKLKSLKTIVCMDDVTDDLKNTAASASGNLLVSPPPPHPFNDKYL